MINKKFKIITSGFDCEYVLEGLCQFLRNRGYQVNELDFSHFHEDPVEFLSKFRNEKVVYITSAHVNLSQKTALTAVDNSVELYPNYLSPIEIIPLLRPQVSIYIPHDLIDPYGGGGGPNELRFMDLFDHILAPTDAKLIRSVLPNTTQVHDAGWIKYIDDVEQKNIYKDSKINVLLFVCMIEYLRAKFGVKGVVEYLLPLLKKNVHIKLPRWKGVDEIEEAIRQVGSAAVIPSHYSTIPLIKKADIVVCNGVSSVHAESSLMGRPTICLLDNEGILPNEQKRKLQYFPNIYYYDYRDKSPLPKSLLQHISMQPTAAPLIQPFQYSLVEKIIENS